MAREAQAELRVRSCYDYNKSVPANCWRAMEPVKRERRDAVQDMIDEVGLRTRAIAVAG